MAFLPEEGTVELQPVLVDSNVLLDVISEDPAWFEAHAAVRGLRLLTRDAGRYATYFPTVELIAPPR